MAKTGIDGGEHYTIRMACLAIAREIQVESPATPNHDERLQLAESVIRDSASLSLQFAVHAEAVSYPTYFTWKNGDAAVFKTMIEAIWDTEALLRYEVPAA